MHAILLIFQIFSVSHHAKKPTDMVNIRQNVQLVCHHGVCRTSDNRILDANGVIVNAR